LHEIEVKKSDVVMRGRISEKLGEAQRILEKLGEGGRKN